MTKLKKGNIYCEGSSKIFYETNDENYFIMHYKDEVFSNITGKGQEVAGKGALCNRISEFIMDRLQDIGIYNHFIENINMKEQLIVKADPLVFKVRINNLLNNYLVNALALEEGVMIPNPIMEFFIQNQQGMHVLLNSDHLIALGFIDKIELDEIILTTYRVNDYLSGLFNAIGVRFVAASLRFGRVIDGDTSRLILIDDITPDNCKLWDLKTNETLDFERIDKANDTVLHGYHTIAKKFNLV